jgi:Tfp pilus assembly protein PilF
MHSCLTRQFAALLLGVAIVTGSWATATMSDAAAQPPPAQPAASAAALAEKELEFAAAKAREGKIEEAFGIIKEKAAKHPEWPPARLILARLLFNANQAAPGRHALEQAAAEAPDDPDVYLTLGGIALGEGRISDARLNFDQVLLLVAAGQSNAEKITILRREAFAGLATVAEAREDWKTTQERLNGWLALEPKNGRVRQRLGRALFQLGKTEDAFAAFTQAVKDEPALEPAAVSMALLQTRKGDFKKAEEWFDYARKFEPKSARVRLDHARWLLDQGRASDARAEIDEALKLDPASKEAQKVQALIAWHLRNLAAAETILEPLHRDAPADFVVANLLALALIEQDDAAKQSRGLQLADVNAMQFPRSAEVVATFGWALYRAGKFDQAEQKLRAAVTSGRTTPDIAYFLARVLVDKTQTDDTLKKAQTDDARKLLQSATNLPGAFAHRDDANVLLKKLTN